MAELVAVEGLAKRYGRRAAVEALTLRLAPGGVFGLVGGNGGGKTTALRLLAGLLAPDAGGGSVLGWDLRRQARDIRAAVGYMSQRLSLYAELSVRENLLFRARVYGIGAARAAAEAAIADLDLTPYAATPAGRLSGGGARRLQLAACLVHAPALVLLDEPTAGLDATARHDVWRRLGALAARGVGVIVSTHDLAEAEWCGEAAFLSEGRVIAAGTPEAITRSAPAIALLLEADGARGLGAPVEALPGVIASYPPGAVLRIVADAGAEAPLAVLARAHRGRLARTAMRLEDAARAFARRAPHGRA